MMAEDEAGLARSVVRPIWSQKDRNDDADVDADDKKTILWLSSSFVCGDDNDDDVRIVTLPIATFRLSIAQTDLTYKDVFQRF